MTDFPYEVRKKIIKSGQLIEIFEYETPYWVGWPRIQRFKTPAQQERDEWRKRTFKTDQTKIREDNVRRTRLKISRIISANPQLKTFLTLTFKDEVLDLKTANKLFDRFVKRISHAQKDFQYLAVPEFQNHSKRVHYHLISNYRLPEWKTTQEKQAHERNFADKYWKNGFINFTPVEANNKLGSYVSKYLSKEMFDKRYFRKKKFFYSKNLNLPQIIDYPEEVDRFLDFFEPETLDLVKEEEYSSSQLGQIKHAIYTLPKLNDQELENLFNNLKQTKKTSEKEINVDAISF